MQQIICQKTKDIFFTDVAFGSDTDEVLDTTKLLIQDKSFIRTNVINRYRGLMRQFSRVSNTISSANAINIIERNDITLHVAYLSSVVTIPVQGQYKFYCRCDSEEIIKIAIVQFGQYITNPHMCMFTIDFYNGIKTSSTSEYPFNDFDNSSWFFLGSSTIKTENDIHTQQFSSFIPLIIKDNSKNWHISVTFGTTSDSLSNIPVNIKIDDVNIMPNNIEFTLLSGGAVPFLESGSIASKLNQRLDEFEELIKTQLGSASKYFISR